MATSGMLCRRANRLSWHPGMVPSLFMISQMTPEGWRPARLAKSTAASVCPARTSTPALFARSGKTWPGRIRSEACRRVNCGEHGGRDRRPKFPWCTLLRLDADTKAVQIASCVQEHEWNFERIEMLGCHRQQTSPRPYCAMKIDDLRCNLLSGDSQSPSFSRFSSSTTIHCPRMPPLSMLANERAWLLGSLTI